MNNTNHCFIKKEKMQLQLYNPYMIIYDKYIPNKHGGISLERRVIASKFKEMAMYLMKKDVYLNGVVSAGAVARLPNGETIYFKVYKQPQTKYEPRQIKMHSKLMYSEILNGSEFGKLEKPKCEAVQLR